MDLDGDGHTELIAAESGRGAVYALSPLTGRSRLDAREVAPLFTTPPLGIDGGVEGMVAARTDQVALVTRSAAGIWHVQLREPFETTQIDVRPGFADDVVLKPGIVVVGVPNAGATPGLVPETARANGARPIAHTIEDINSDGLPDLKIYFRSDDMQLNPEHPTLVLTGRDRAGRYLRGSAPIRLILASAGR